MNAVIQIHRAGKLLCLGVAEGDFLAITPAALFLGLITSVIVTLIHWHRMKGWSRAEGVIIDKREDLTSEYGHVSLITEFRDRHGNANFASGHGTVDPRKYDKCQKVTVIYDPNRLGSARVDAFRFKYYGHFVIGGVLLMTTAMAVAALMVSERDQCIGVGDVSSCLPPPR